MNIIVRNLPVTYASWAVRITFKIGAKVKNLPGYAKKVLFFRLESPVTDERELMLWLESQEQT